ncbi:hypothetical protein HPB49_003701 [Dermacentor silvarum]|uniref:Uncharacterized protein n=1 Tax=Dermacentor silvarum TaxID=543639 RepID=A0ACB8DTG6_DERSI|nr:hypothetical protein HPB49_003701 [Dermacentor silvarum]
MRARRNSSRGVAGAASDNPLGGVRAMVDVASTSSGSLQAAAENESLTSSATSSSTAQQEDDPSVGAVSLLSSASNDTERIAPGCSGALVLALMLAAVCVAVIAIHQGLGLLAAHDAAPEPHGSDAKLRPADAHRTSQPNGSAQGVLSTTMAPHGSVSKISATALHKTTVADDAAAETSSGEDTSVTHKDNASPRKGTRPECGAPQFTLCAESRREFFYRAEAGTCAVATQAASSFCNRSPNRFASLRSCRRSCVDAIMPAQRCFDKPVLGGCSGNLVATAWWFFDGRRCVQWQFPGGQCPVPGHAFRSLAQCHRQCGAGRKSRKPAWRCRRPSSRTCSGQQLRFPYFAHMSRSGRILCLQVSADRVLQQRCLVGANRFHSLAGCRAACVTHRTPFRPRPRVAPRRRRSRHSLRRLTARARKGSHN